MADKWDKASDEALVAAAEEDAPPAKAQDMLRQMFGGEKTVTGKPATWRKPDDYLEPDWEVGRTKRT